MPQHELPALGQRRERSTDQTRLGQPVGIVDGAPLLDLAYVEGDLLGPVRWELSAAGAATNSNATAAAARSNGLLRTARSPHCDRSNLPH